MKTTLALLVSSLGSAFLAQGADFTFSGGTIPDGGSQAFVGTIGTQTGYISSLMVGLSISGQGPGYPAFNGDLYVTLQKGTGFSVLLNRVGRSTGSSYGYGDNGMVITLDDSLTSPGVRTYSDVHTYRLPSGDPLTGPLTGRWSTDGRNVDPGVVLDTTPRSLTLGSFTGVLANGDWTLFVADLSAGGYAKLTSWSLTIETTLTPIPEPAWAATVAALGLTGYVWLRRRRPPA